jgi:hypothetical protein
MKNFNSKTFALVVLSFALVKLDASAQNNRNYQAALVSNMGVLSVSQTEADLNRSYMASKKIGENQIERHITPDYASFYDLTSYKYFASEALKKNGKVTRFNQARKGKENHYDYETISIADDGSINSYTYCNVDPAKPGESNCHTVNSNICDEFAKAGLNRQAVNQDLEKCAKLENDLATLKKTVSSPENQKVIDENLNAINQSPVRKFVFGEASANVAKKKIDDVPVAKQDNMQLMNDISDINQSCGRLVNGGFMSVASHAPAANPPTNQNAAEGR